MSVSGRVSLSVVASLGLAEGACGPAPLPARARVRAAAPAPARPSSVAAVLAFERGSRSAEARAAGVCPCSCGGVWSEPGSRAALLAGGALSGRVPDGAWLAEGGVFGAEPEGAPSWRVGRGGHPLSREGGLVGGSRATARPSHGAGISPPSSSAFPDACALGSRLNLSWRSVNEAPRISLESLPGRRPLFTVSATDDYGNRLGLICTSQGHGPGADDGCVPARVGLSGDVWTLLSESEAVALSVWTPADPSIPGSRSIPLNRGGGGGGAGAPGVPAVGPGKNIEISAGCECFPGSTVCPCRLAGMPGVRLV